MYKMRNIMNPAVCYIQKLLGGWILKVLITRGKYEMLDVRWTYCDDHFMTLCQIMMLEGNGTPKIPWAEEPGGLQSMGLLRVGYDWATSLSLFTFMHWRRKWQPTPVFLPGESQGWGSLVGCRLRGRRVRPDWSDLAAADMWNNYWNTRPIVFNQIFNQIVGKNKEY